MNIGDMERAQMEAYLRHYMTNPGKPFPGEKDPVDAEVEELMADTRQFLEDLGIDGDRGEKAELLIDRMIPTMIDVTLWRNLAIGKNIHLPATDQYGPISDRLAPSDPKVTKPGRGNAYGRVHSKGSQAPSDFMKRQGMEIEKATRRVLKLEEELQSAREDRENLDHGLKLYAATCLITAMRQSTASIFAMGPAWSLLKAIRASSGPDVQELQSRSDTAKILVILHALRDHHPFLEELKAAILAVCNRHDAQARKHPREFNDLHDYEGVLQDLEWPQWIDLADIKPDPAKPCSQCGFVDEDEDRTEFVWPRTGGGYTIKRRHPSA